MNTHTHWIGVLGQQHYLTKIPFYSYWVSAVYLFFERCAHKLQCVFILSTITTSLELIQAPLLETRIILLSLRRTQAQSKSSSARQLSLLTKGGCSETQTQLAITWTGKSHGLKVTQGCAFPPTGWRVTSQCLWLWDFKRICVRATEQSGSNHWSHLSSEEAAGTLGKQKFTWVLKQL